MDAKTLALYLGLQVKVLNDKRDGVLIGIFISRKITWAPEGKLVKEIPIAIIEHDEQINNFEIHDVTLVLRPFDSMTESESEEYQKLSRFNTRESWAFAKSQARAINYLRSVGIDCDELIEKGEAFDSTTLTPTP